MAKKNASKKLIAQLILSRLRVQIYEKRPVDQQNPASIGMV